MKNYLWLLLLFIAQLSLAQSKDNKQNIRGVVSDKLSQSFSLDLQNITNNKNVFSQSYDDRRRVINTTYQLGFFPNFIYKIQF
jgi:hypothetical protein